VPCNLWRRSGVVGAVTNKFLFETQENHVLRKKTLIALAAAVALGCVPVATNALAAGHQNNGHGGGGQAFAGHGGGHAMAGPARVGNGSAGYARSGRGSAGYAGGGRVVVRSGGGGYYGGGPIYDSCAGYDSGYGYSGCPGYGVPIVGAVINGIFGGYGGY
jgi:hypothetical protein